MAHRTLAATRAAAADHAERALDVCLKQPAFRQPDARVTISLLRVSKQLAALVAERCGGGALAVRTSVEKPAQADALAAWLSSHGGLLAELDLGVLTVGPGWSAAEAQCGQKQHLAVRVLEQLPGSLTRLVFASSGPDDVKAEQAAALAAAFSRQLMQLRQLVLPESLRDQAATLLPALRQLSQLTSLVMWLPRRSDQLPVQHLQHLPVQLQQLELHGLRGCSAADVPWLALPHLTGLTSLSAPRVCVDGGTLPRGLRALTVADIRNAAPVLQLEHLTALQLLSCRAAAEQLRQLSALQRLEQLSVRMPRVKLQDTLSNAAPALGVLPLVRLTAVRQQLTAACLDHLGTCARLMQLRLYSCSLAPGVTPEQLAAMLGRLTALERFEAGYMQLQPAASDAAWAPVCQALARLPRLAACDLSGVKLGPAAAAQLTTATQLTELRLAACDLDDASLLALCGGLTGLRRLDVSINRSLGDGCLEGIAALRQLSWLRMRYTRVTEAGRQQLQVARPELQLEV